MSLIQKLKRSFGSSRICTGEKILEEHSTDAWLMAHKPDAVIFAKSTSDVSRVMRFCSRHRLPVTVRGAGVGYVGGCVPMKGGLVLSLAKMNRIKEINIHDGVAVVQPGVITGDLQDAVRKQKFFYPPDPASLKECTIGGNIATNAGGPRCLKYGVTRHYVLGLEVVLSTGEILRIGGRTHKNKTGFDLVGMFVGSEGMLGTVTEITARIIPHPPTRACLSIGFQSEKMAAAAVLAILKRGHLPSALEITDRFTLQAVRKQFSNGRSLPFELPKGNSLLFVEVDGQETAVRNEIQSIHRFLKSQKALSFEMAHGDLECERLWEIRRECSRSLKTTGLIKLNEDITVPRSRLVDLFKFAHHLQKKFKIPIACFGHAGDGNIHVNLMVDRLSRNQSQAAEVALDELFRKILAWNGAITGEHGIGLAKKKWWPLAVSPEVQDLHQKLKKLLDPSGILNPGKFLKSA